MKKKILIVDDSDVNRIILKGFLSDDYKIIEADNGDAAITMISKNHDIVAILLDLYMPKKDGFEVLKKMNCDSYMSQIPVIVITSADNDDSEIMALSLGAYDYVVKPYNPVVIRRRLSNVINFKESVAVMNYLERDSVTGLYSKQSFNRKVIEILNNNQNLDFDIVCAYIANYNVICELFSEQSRDDLMIHLAGVFSSTKYGSLVSARPSESVFVFFGEHNRNFTKETFSEITDEACAFFRNIRLDIRYGVYQVEDRDTMELEDVGIMCDRALAAARSVRGMYSTLYAIYDESMRKKLLEKQDITGYMEDSIKNNQFIVYYQPKYDPYSETISGAEALVRWQHPTRGFMTPDQFIPAFEKNGFILELDHFVWETVCKNVAEWKQRGIPTVPVSVNVSRTDLFNTNLSKELLDMLTKYGLKIDDIHLEITETTYIQNTEQLLYAVAELKRNGFILEMDDFGSGYSSLNVLSEMPVDIIKLDREFVANGMRAKGRKLLEFAVMLAKNLEVDIVAEGVETRNQIDILKQLGCKYVQGYYFARPLEIMDYENHIKKVGISMA